MTKVVPTAGNDTGVNVNPISSTVVGSIDPNSWQAQMLQAIGKATGVNVPVTKTNVLIMDAWTSSEGTLYANNPFAISGVHPGATKCIAQCGSSSPIMAYDTIQNGIAANADFIAHGYTNIAQNLSNSTPNDSAMQAASVAQGVFQAINQSGWCKGCQSGNYPIGLYNLIVAFTKGQVPSFSGITASAAGAVDKTSVTGIVGNYAGAAAGTVTSWTESLGKILSKLTSANFWLRVGFVVAGLILLGIGVTFILSESKTVQSAKEAAPALATML